LGGRELAPSGVPPRSGGGAGGEEDAVVVTVAMVRGWVWGALTLMFGLLAFCVLGCWMATGAVPFEKAIGLGDGFLSGCVRYVLLWGPFLVSAWCASRQAKCAEPAS
jgi:hypothetical protein